MQTVYLIACCARKQSHPAPASELYASALFHKSLAVARQTGNDIWILSARYGLLALDSVIAPYDETLAHMSPAARKQWAVRVAGALRERYRLADTHFVFLAGQRYAGELLPSLPNTLCPLAGLRIGQLLQFLQRQLQKGGGDADVPTVVGDARPV
jgi:hypothetical protein